MTEWLIAVVVVGIVFLGATVITTAFAFFVGRGEAQDRSLPARWMDWWAELGKRSVRSKGDD